VHRRTNVTLASIHNQPNVTPDPTNATPADANITPGQSHDQSDVTPDPTNVTLGQIHDHSNVTPTRPTSPSRLEERFRCVVRGKSRGAVSDQSFASASRDVVRRRHGDARLCRRLDELGSITGLRFSLGLRPPLTPLCWPGSQCPGEQGLILAPRHSEWALNPSPACCGQGPSVGSQRTPAGNPEQLRPSLHHRIKGRTRLQGDPLPVWDQPLATVCSRLSGHPGRPWRLAAIARATFEGSAVTVTFGSPRAVPVGQVSLVGRIGPASRRASSPPWMPS